MDQPRRHNHFSRTWFQSCFGYQSPRHPSEATHRTPARARPDTRKDAPEDSDSYAPPPKLDSDSEREVRLKTYFGDSDGPNPLEDSDGGDSDDEFYGTAPTNSQATIASHTYEEQHPSDLNTNTTTSINNKRVSTSTASTDPAPPNGCTTGSTGNKFKSAISVPDRTKSVVPLTSPHRTPIKLRAVPLPILRASSSVPPLLTTKTS